MELRKKQKMNRYIDELLGFWKKGLVSDREYFNLLHKKRKELINGK